jgi:copper chaperone NosL
MTRLPCPSCSIAARPRRPLLLLALLGALALGACQNAGTAAPRAAAVTRDTPCSLDGMTLADFPGPKAQILYERGAPDFFCDTIELFATVLRPEQPRRIVAIYVQDMALADWNDPQGHWIDARSAFYVAGSDQHGSMGATLASFATEAAARGFAARHGGAVYRFDQVTPQMAVLDGGVLKDHRM